MEGSECAVKVVARFRPPTSDEEEARGREEVEADFQGTNGVALAQHGELPWPLLGLSMPCLICRGCCATPHGTNAMLLSSP